MFPVHLSKSRLRAAGDQFVIHSGVWRGPDDCSGRYSRSKGHLQARGGEFVLSDSAARDELCADSGVDVLLDFPAHRQAGLQPCKAASAGVVGVTMPTRMQNMIERRVRQRRLTALRHALSTLNNLRETGVDAYVIGSLVTGRFMHHSDVDYLVCGHVEPVLRSAVEKVIAAGMENSGIPYDVIYSEDIKDDVLQEFCHDKADPSRLFELAHEAGPA